MTLYDNVLPIEVLEKLTDYFWGNREQHIITNGMRKLQNPWSGITKELLTPYLRNYVDISECLGDNYFYHEKVYLVHTDYHKHESINVLIPLALGGIQEQYFILFDQLLDDEGRTFTGDLQLTFQSNKSAPGPLSQYNLLNSTRHPISYDFYEKYLNDSLRPYSMFDGLTGNAYLWNPGSIMLFNSKQLHCTGKMNVPWKLGLSLRFKVSNENNN